MTLITLADKVLVKEDEVVLGATGDTAAIARAALKTGKINVTTLTHLRAAQFILPLWRPLG